MMIKETSLRRDPDLRGELAFLARGCDFVLPSRFKKRLKSFQQTQFGCDEINDHDFCLLEPTTNKINVDLGENSMALIQNKPEKKPGTPLPPPATSPSSPRPLSPVPHVNNIVNAPLSINIPRFYFPEGLPDTCSNHGQTLSRIETAFMDIEDQKADIYEMGKIAKELQFCKYLLEVMELVHVGRQVI
ncbi:hypothetical protein P7K49_031614 [Saguinus oedipus]|uniref:Uncharacterized protein n=1 Tax=Saguinus oedipus TaxID=9490 RepID=A0ABQ9TZX0_SAGOE|nr:hypothetical protein P7K49_031614 [Saguinus oedipus]